ncbi:hypothetical protein BDQ17DRAFT_1397259 [Cyathus striatus]|nr:hypothetical protein BDQ17DRAFT_1397259 [Cyathus striatus]
MSGGIAAGAGVGWSGWLGWFMGTGEGLFGVVGMEPTTAVGVGMLGAIVSMRWAVGRWESAKKKWWADWTRVGEGLDRDLRTTVHQVVSENVVVVPDSACKGLFEMTSTRKEEMATVQEKMEKMSAELQAINERP